MKGLGGDGQRRGNTLHLEKEDARASGPLSVPNYLYETKGRGKNGTTSPQVFGEACVRESGPGMATCLKETIPNEGPEMNEARSVQNYLKEDKRRLPKGQGWKTAYPKVRKRLFVDLRKGIQAR